MTTPSAPGRQLYPANNPPESAPVVADATTFGKDVAPQTPTLYPTAVSGPQSAAIHGLGEVLKTIIHSSHYFPTENQVDAAMAAVDKWVNTSVKSHELGAILTGEERAPKEDVTKRIPPGGPMPTAQVGPQIDYRQLAEAIIAAQQRLQLEGSSE